MASGEVIKAGNFTEISADAKCIKELGTGTSELCANPQPDNVSMLSLSVNGMGDSNDYAATLLYPGRTGSTQDCDVSTISNKGDYRLYHYYLSAIGWKHTAIFFVLLICLVVAAIFQCRFPIGMDFFEYNAEIYPPALVLKWWVGVDVPVASSIKKYLPIFVGVSVLNLMFLVGGMG